MVIKSKACLKFNIKSFFKFYLESLHGTKMFKFKLLPADTEPDSHYRKHLIMPPTAIFDSCDPVLSAFCVSFLLRHSGSDNLCNYGEKRVAKESLSLWASVTCEGQTAGDEWTARTHIVCAGGNFSNDKAKLFFHISQWRNPFQHHYGL